MTHRWVTCNVSVLSTCFDWKVLVLFFPHDIFQTTVHKKPWRSSHRSKSGLIKFLTLSVNKIYSVDGMSNNMRLYKQSWFGSTIRAPLHFGIASLRYQPRIVVKKSMHPSYWLNHKYPSSLASHICWPIKMLGRPDIIIWVFVRLRIKSWQSSQWLVGIILSVIKCLVLRIGV